MSNDQEVYSPSSMTRDKEGRLVGLVFDSRPPIPATPDNLWLVAVDGSDNALRALDVAVLQALQRDTCVLHLIHVEQWLSKEAAEAELALRALQATARARAKLDSAGQPWRLHVAMGEPAESILALAGHLGCSRIVIGNRGLSLAESLLCGSVTHKVMQQSELPVLVVP